jgi:hypothetical protein
MSISGFSSKIIEVLPVTDQILMIHFDDGYVIPHKIHQKRNNESVVVVPLNISKASAINTYLLYSNNDAIYAKGKHPEEIGRKSKGTEYAWLCETWMQPEGCVNINADHAKEHWVYLFFADKFQRGKTYKLNTGDLAENGKERTFIFDEFNLRSETVHVNQIGYVPDAPLKIGYLYSWLGDKGGLDLKSYSDNSFHLVDIVTGEKKFSGKIALQVKFGSVEETPYEGETFNKSFIDADVYECDFSAFKDTGSFKLVVEGIGHSFSFGIHPDIYRQVFLTTTRGLYHNRSGIELKMPYTKYLRPAPHNPNITPGFKNKMMYTSHRWMDWKDENSGQPDIALINANMKGPLNTWGFYQDAGDWDGYYSHTNIPAMMLLVFQLHPENFTDGELNIPESGNGIPDMLDEAAWLLRYIYRTRHAIMDAGYGTGGVGLRVCGDPFGDDGEGMPSWEDTSRIYVVSGEDPFSTYKYAAIAAEMSYCLKLVGKKDPQGVDWEKEAIASYTWAKQNTRAGDDDKKTSYGCMRDARIFAAAALYKITERPEYLEQFKSDAGRISSEAFLEGDVKFAAYSFATGPSFFKNQNEMESRIYNSIKYTGETFMLNTAKKRACRWGNMYYVPMLVGHGTTPYVFEGLMAYEITKVSEPEYAREMLKYVYTTFDYFLGNNALNQTYVTGLGDRFPQFMFHMDSWYRESGYHPGLIPYGQWRVDPSHLVNAGPWLTGWAHKTVFPNIDLWPGHERFFDNRCSPMGAEFTVHQNTVTYSAISGALLNKINK